MKPMEPMQPMEPMHDLTDDPGNQWWPESLGSSPDSAGSQNNVRYAYFAAKNRLAVESGDGVRVYATGDHLISGVSQGQGKNAVFTSQRGEVSLDDLQPADT